MPTDYKEAMKDIGAGMKTLQDHAGDAVKAFSGLHHAAIKDGAVTSKHKELIALGIAIHTQCEDCIVSHVRSGLKAGATIEEIGETVGVAIMMGGGPAVMYGYKALQAAKELG